MLSLSMVVIAALVGAGGLGVPVVRALNSVQVGMGFEAGFTIVLLAIIWIASAGRKSTGSPMTAAVEFRARRHPVRAAARDAPAARAMREALTALDGGATRADIQSSTAWSSASPAPV